MHNSKTHFGGSIDMETVRAGWTRIFPWLLTAKIFLRSIRQPDIVESIFQEFKDTNKICIIIRLTSKNYHSVFLVKIPYLADG